MQETIVVSLQVASGLLMAAPRAIGSARGAAEVCPRVKREVRKNRETHRQSAKKFDGARFALPDARAFSRRKSLPEAITARGSCWRPGNPNYKYLRKIRRLCASSSFASWMRKRTPCESVTR